MISCRALPNNKTKGTLLDYLEHISKQSIVMLLGNISFSCPQINGIRYIAEKMKVNFTVLHIAERLNS